MDVTVRMDSGRQATLPLTVSGNRAELATAPYNTGDVWCHMMQLVTDGETLALHMVLVELYDESDVSIGLGLGSKSPSGPHVADQNGDWRIQLSPELTRLVQFFNAGGYHRQPGTEDGYAPGPGDQAGMPHDADQNADWRIQLTPELTRLIQFYNSGGYHVEQDTEDGYAPGLSASGRSAPKLDPPEWLEAR